MLLRAVEQKISRALVFLLILMLMGCSSNQRFATKVEEIKVVPNPIEKELKADVITDTLIITNEIVNKDTITIVKYYPLEKKFYLKVKPDTIKFYRVDTLIINNTKIEQKEKIDYRLLVLFFALGIILTLTIWRKQ